jgi:hypothetical protein
MTDNDRDARRKALKREHREGVPEAGVYQIVNAQTGRTLIASTANIGSIENRFAFAQATNSPGALDGRLTADIKEHGIEAFSFEVLERFEPAAEAARGAFASDLAALEALWREKLGPANLY